MHFLWIEYRRCLPWHIGWAFMIFLLGGSFFAALLGTAIGHAIFVLGRAAMLSYLRRKEK